MTDVKRFEIANLPEMEALGRRLGLLLFPGAVIALVGPLGAGKTHLTRAIAEGLDVVHPSIVTSPTFVLIQEYPARLPIYHFDAYRLRDAEAFEELGVSEYFTGDGVCLVEWADRVWGAMPRELLRVDIQPTGEHSRRVELTAIGEPYKALLSSLNRC